jgi:hypothetical protein
MLKNCLKKNLNSFFTEGSKNCLIFAQPIIFFNLKHPTIMAKRRLNRYRVAQPYMAERLKDPDWQDQIVKKWVFFRKAPHLHNNLATHSLLYNTRKRRFQLGDRMGLLRFSMPSPASVISSSLALYRLMCLFKYPPVMPPPQEIYKTLWQYPLKHRATGNYLTLLEYKAGFTINTYFHDAKDVPEEFAKDMLDLLDFLISDQVAHPYDGVLAGTVA